MAPPLRFVLRQTSDTAVFQHLVLCAANHQLIHWVLPGAAQRLLDGLPYYLLCEAPTSSPLPAYEADGGECSVKSSQQATPTQVLEDGIQAGWVQLHLHGQQLHGDFTLARLSSESHIWRLSVGHPVVQSIALRV